jgi:hypothetical protein
MTDGITASAFIQRVATAWDDWSRLVSRLQSEGLERYASSGSWTLADVIAHICWHEREMVGILDQRRFAGSPLWDLPTDERNAVIFDQYKDRPPAEVVAAAAMIHGRLMTLLGSVTDRDLLDPASFPGMPAEWLPWQVIAGNTYEHYEDHAARIRARLAAGG